MRPDLPAAVAVAAAVAAAEAAVTPATAAVAPAATAVTPAAAVVIAVIPTPRAYRRPEDSGKDGRY